jgi:hypothetical protein
MRVPPLPVATVAPPVPARPPVPGDPPPVPDATSIVEAESGLAASPPPAVLEQDMADMQTSSIGKAFRVIAFLLFRDISSSGYPTS